MKKIITIIVIIVLLRLGDAKASTWTTFDVPNSYNTSIYDIEGSKLIFK